MSISTRLDQGVLSIRIMGRFDFSVHNEFRQAIQLASSGVTKTIVDLSGTEYLDSSALGMLLVLRDKVGGGKEMVHITGSQSEVKKILAIANFDKLFTLD